ncbi:hypothetical protein [Saccharopolyspora hattusasensis]|uniref:hypothetical protein n=1 Tax=Saccharopolyspora hattusasensis TaxID=1128679 RepID=UPI003D95791E
MIVVLDVEQAEVDLRAGVLRCPRCAGCAAAVVVGVRATDPAARRLVPATAAAPGTLLGLSGHAGAVADRVRAPARGRGRRHRGRAGREGPRAGISHDRA